MRLRLSIKRHELPTVKLLHSVSCAETLPISALVSQIDHIVPLESGSWGVEDYIVSVNGFECLHYANVNEVLNNGDEVEIRAVETADVHARQLAGRTQISHGGARLLDGVPYGRTHLNRSQRPPVSIPPLKSRRLLTLSESGEDQDDNEGDDEDFAEEFLSSALPDEDDSLESNENIDPDEVRALTEEQRLSKLNERGAYTGRQSAEIGKKRKHVQIEEPWSDVGESDADFEDTGSSAASPESTSDGSEESCQSESESSESITLNHNTAQDRGQHSYELSEPDTQDLSSEETSSSSDSSEEDEEGDNNGDDTVLTTPSGLPIPSAKGSARPLQDETKRRTEKVPPGCGLRRTKSRNGRRKQHNYNLWKARQDTLNQNDDDTDSESRNITIPRKIVFTDEPEQDQTHAKEPTMKIGHGGEHVEAAPSTTTPSSAPKRRFVVGPAALRMIRHGLGSIGGLGGKKVQAPVDTTASADGGVSGNNNSATDATTQGDGRERNWQDYITLTAVECKAERVDLPPPPFPFKQRWHGINVADFENPSKRRKRNKQRWSNTGLSKVSKDYDPATESYNEGGDALNYDESGENLPDDTTLTNEAMDEQEGFPPAPKDSHRNRRLALESCLPGQFIYFTRLEMHPASGPIQAAFRTAQIEEAESADGGDCELTLKLAMRDVPKEITFRDKKHQIAAERLLLDQDGEVFSRYIKTRFSELTEVYVLNETNTNNESVEATSQSQARVEHDDDNGQATTKHTINDTQSTTNLVQDSVDLGVENAGDDSLEIDNPAVSHEEEA